jgi:hypothetical protein
MAGSHQDCGAGTFVPCPCCADTGWLNGKGIQGSGSYVYQMHQRWRLALTADIHALSNQPKGTGVNTEGTV